MNIEVEEHANTGITTFKTVPDNYRLLRKCTLVNGYGMYYDLYGNIFYITFEAEKSSREEWKGFIVDNDYYIYVE